MNFKKIDTALTDLMERKNAAYGNAYADSFNELGLIYAFVEVNNKLQRIKALTMNPDIPDNGESIFDSYVDLRNYAELAISQMIEYETVSKETLEKYGLSDI